MGAGAGVGTPLDYGMNTYSCNLPGYPALRSLSPKPRSAAGTPRSLWIGLLTGGLSLCGFLHAAVAAEYLVPTSIPHDYSSDVTTNLQAFLDAVPNGSVIRFPSLAYDPLSTGYRIEGTLTLSRRSDLTIEGNGAVIRAFDALDPAVYNYFYIRSRSQWRTASATNIVFRDLVVYGAHTNGGAAGTYDEDREAQMAFDITSRSDGVLIDRCAAYNTFGDGIYVGGDSRRITIRHSTVARVGRQCIAPCSGSDMLIQSNVLTDSRRGIIDIEPYAANWRVDNIRILDNTLGNSRLLCFPMAGGGQYGAIFIGRNVAVSNNGVPKIAYARDNAPGRRGPFIVLDNRFAIGGSPAAGIDAKPVDGIFFAGNQSTMPANRLMTGLRLRDCRGAVAANNLFQGSAVPVSADAVSRACWFSGNATSDVAWAGETISGEFALQPACYYASAPFSNGTALAVWRMTDSLELLTWDGLSTRGRFASAVLDHQGALVAGFGFDGPADFQGTPVPWLRPPVPSNVLATVVSPYRIDLDWVPSPDPCAATVAEWSLDGSNWVWAGTFPYPTAGAAITNLHHDTLYAFRLWASNAISLSIYSLPVQALSANVLPLGPTGLWLTVVSDGRIDLGWTDCSDNEDGFRIERADDNAGVPGTWSPAGSAGRNTGVYTDTGLSASTRYHYRVCATNELGDSPFLEQASATTGILRPPAPPGPLGQTNRIDAGRITLFWTDSSDNEAGFELERANDEDGRPGDWAQVARPGPDACLHSDSGLSSGTVYHYRLRAFNGAGHSAYTPGLKAGTASAVTETWPGVNGAPWPDPWMQIGASLGCTIQSGWGQMGATSVGRTLMAIDGILAEDVEQCVRMNINNNSVYAGFFARLAERDTDTYYGCEAGTASANCRIFKVIDGVKTTLAAVPAILTGTNYWMRFRVESVAHGTRLSYKNWLVGEPEPAPWTVAITNAEPRLQHKAGRFGLYGSISIAGSRRIWFDDYAVSAARAFPPSPGFIFWLSRVAKPILEIMAGARNRCWATIRSTARRWSCGRESKRDRRWCAVFPSATIR